MNTITVAGTPMTPVVPSSEEHIIFYNVSSVFRENLSRPNESWPPYLYTNYQLHNDSFEEVTVFSSIRKSPVSSQMPLSVFNIVLKNVDNFVMPAAMGLGIVCTVFLILTFMCTPLKASALSHYLTALGVADLIYLCSCLIFWGTKRGFALYNKMGFCQLTAFSLLLSRFLATWYLFAAHAERFVIHFGSCRARKWCTTFRTKCIIIVIFVFSLVGFSHYIWIFNVTEKGGVSSCVLMEESVKYIIELGKIEIITASFLPMLLIVAIDIALCTSIAAAYGKAFFSKAKSHGTQNGSWRGEYTLTETERSKSPSTRSGDSNPPPPEFDLSLEKTHATATVVIAGLVFICLILPSSIYRAKNSFSRGSRPSRDEFNLMAAFEECVKFNSIYKLFLYLILLRAFRHGVMSLFKNRFRKKPKEDPLQETSV
ncbi:unnamed protein product [Lymnaea stagnalis]|uniref:G-protein coupled receptors family 1 profile domain-containing protein n=1 Tax=Lymnaea stagnalis TaxID=6523 RepID=A0AAV2I9A1_LYMST